MQPLTCLSLSFSGINALAMGGNQVWGCAPRDTGPTVESLKGRDQV